MIKHPKNILAQLSDYLKLSYQQTHKLVRKLSAEGYIKLYLMDTYSVELDGYIFVKEYYKNIFKDLFKNYIFQIILVILSFLLGRLSR